MMGPRWHKIANDLWGNKTRTLLVVLSIAIGIFAVGVVTQTFTTVEGVLAAEYPSANAASASFTTDLFDDDLLQTVRRMDAVEAAEGQSLMSVRVRVGTEWKPMLISAREDYGAIQINKIFPQFAFQARPEIGAEGTAWPPPERGVLIERASFLLPGMLPEGAHVGSMLTIQTPDEKERQLLLAGIVHDPGEIPPTFAATAYGYISLDTLEWLAGTRQMDRLLLRTTPDRVTRDQITRVAEQVRAKIENGGRAVYTTTVPVPGRNPMQDIFQGLLLILNALGLGSLFLSGFLITNTVSALLAQQVRYIGVMKAIGARRGQLVAMYLVTVLAYGLLAILVAVPASAYVSSITARLLAGFVNVDPPPFTFIPEVLAVQVAIALLFPVVAAIAPVWSGTRLTVQQAIANYGLAPSSAKPGRANPLLPLIRLLSRPLMLSLGNTFRRKARLTFTLATLVLGGAIFIAVFSVRGAMLRTLDDALSYWSFDVLFAFNRPYRSDMIDQIVAQTPGIVAAETWGLETVRRVRPNATESDSLTLFAPPPDTVMLRPTLIGGRWLLPGDDNAIVVSNGLVSIEPDIHVGDTITMTIRGKQSAWHVVGLAVVVGRFGSGVANVYVNYPYYARLVGEVGRAVSIQLTTTQHDKAFQDRIVAEMTEQFKLSGVKVSQSLTNSSIRENNAVFFNILVSLLLIMAVLMAVVGALGLMGTMSLNVMERTREIGVLRAIGASNSAVREIVMAEGVLIGLISWLASALVSVELGRLVSDALGTIIFQIPLNYAVSSDGIVIWFVVVVVISGVASLLPAQRAARLTIREVLAYE